MVAAVKTVFRVNVWSIVDGAPAGNPTRVGCVPTLDEALVVAAGHGDWAPATMWNFNPANKQIWRYNAAGDRLYAIKRVSEASIRKEAEAAHQAEMAARRAAAKAAWKDGAALKAALTFDTVEDAFPATEAEVAFVKNAEANVEALQKEAAASYALRLAAAKASERLDTLEVAVEVAAAKSDAALPL